MTYFSIIELTPAEDSWMAAYSKEVPAIVAKYGGVYRAKTTNHEQIEGEPREQPKLMVIIEWPNKESVIAFEECPEYQPHLENRKKGAKAIHVLVEGN